MTFFTELEQTTQKFIWNHKRPRIAKLILRKKTNRRQNLPRVQALLQSYNNQDSIVLVQKQTYRQWNRIESTEINLDTYGQLIFDKEGKNIKWEKSLQQVVLGNWSDACKSIKLEHTLTPHTKINSKWLKDLNIKQDTIKILGENIGKTFSDINQIFS